MKQVPSDWPAHERRARAFSSVCRFDDAVRETREAIRIGGGQALHLKKQLELSLSLSRSMGWSRDFYPALALTRKGEVRKALDLFRHLTDRARKVGPPGPGLPRQILAVSHYDLACLYSLASAGKKNPGPPAAIPEEEAAVLRGKAVAHLREAMNYGWSDPDVVYRDSDLDPVRHLPEFKALVAEWEKQHGEGK